MTDLPALFLYPLNGTFAPKHLSLVDGTVVTIGRQCNARTVPTVENGRFVSKVISRQHAEVWAADGKIFIRDVASANGTYLNGTRVNETQPSELCTGDTLDFGHDFIGDDGSTLVHHRVSARVVCIFTEEDARAATLHAFGVDAPRGGLGGAGAMAAL